ncbi:MAG: uncharacterized protein QOC82_3043 [Frankiaceae bacterium]|jgi:uncharacterized membrane protein YfcA|nr:uncharacterized protein [Frankiaceae bacterium]
MAAASAHTSAPRLASGVVTWPHALAILGVGLVGGAVNTIVGAASLLTFPVLLALGYPAVVANVSNSIGLGVPGSLSGAYGYRRELAGQRRRILLLLPAALAGGAGGAALLLAVPGAFRAVVPWLILSAVALVIVQPRLAAWRARRGVIAEHPGPVLHGGLFATAVYGGYFGAAQGVIMLALFGATLDDDLHRLNAAKNLISAFVNAIAGVVFVIWANVSWWIVLLLGVSSVVGGQIGAVIGRRIPQNALRAAIVVIGTAVAVKLLV